MSLGAAAVSISDLSALDCGALAPLLASLGYQAEAVESAVRLAAGFATDGACRALVARPTTAGDRIVGFATTHVTPFLHRPAAGRVTALAVLPDFQGRGIGRALLTRCEEILFAAGCDRIELTSGSQRGEAHRFYRAAGYAETGVRFVKPSPPS
ncbi:MAG: GNAT family N-acetyltransferase [Thermoanaerobaculia bacterium]